LAALSKRRPLAFAIGAGDKKQLKNSAHTLFQNGVAVLQTCSVPPPLRRILSASCHEAEHAARSSVL
jgi:hypothetical protein